MRPRLGFPVGRHRNHGSFIRRRKRPCCSERAGATARGLEKLWALKDASKDLLTIMNEVSLPLSLELSQIS